MQLVYWLDLFGVFVFAVSGSLSAGRKSLDMFGVVLIALVTALGGGTFRDLLLGNTPVLWVKDPIYIWDGILAAFCTIVFTRKKRFQLRWLMIADAFGLALFTTLGVKVAVAHDVEPIIAILMGVMTGTFGGLIRDVLTNDIPLLLRKEIYALASMLGAGAYCLLLVFHLAEYICVIVSMSVTLIVRLLAIRWGLSVPQFHWNDGSE